MTVDRWVRRFAGFFTVTMLAAILAACGGGTGSKPEPTSIPTTAAARTPSATVASSTPVASASQAASPGATPVRSGSVAGTSASISREEFQKQLKAAFPMEPAAHKGGSIVLGESSDISTVNPILLFDSTTLNIVGTMFETLVGISPVDGIPVPGLADSWDVAPDGLTYTFHLNQKAKWHDGVDITAEDVKFSFDAVLDPNTGSLYTTIVNESVGSYRVVDADTFEVVARDHFVSFLFNGPGAVFIIPRHIWADVDVSAWSFDGGSTGQDASRVIGSGPFKFKEWVQGEHVTVVRNDEYYDVVPNIDELTLAVQPDAEAAVLALQGGETDMMEIIPPAQTQTVIDTPGRAVAIYNFYQITLYGMNLDPVRTPLFQSKEVRQALFYALDRDSITKSIFFGFGEPAIGTQPKLSPAYAPDQMTPNYTFDPVKAKELLTQAGWTDTNNNGTVDKDGVEFKFKLLYSGGDATVDQLVAYMQEAWAQVGVKMELDSISGTALTDRLRAHDYDMFLSGFGLTADGDQSSLFSCEAYVNGFNFMRYCNQEWDRINELQKREFDSAIRTGEQIQLSQMIWEDLPIGPIRFGIARTGYSTRIHNFHPNGYGFLWSLPYIWVDE